MLLLVSNTFRLVTKEAIPEGGAVGSKAQTLVIVVVLAA